MSDIVDRANHAVKLSRAARHQWEQDHALRGLANVVPELVAEIKNLRDKVQALDEFADEVEWFRAEFPDHGYPGGTDG